MKLPLHTMEIIAIPIKNWEEKKSQFAPKLDCIDLQYKEDPDGLLHFGTDRYSERYYIDDFKKLFLEELTEIAKELDTDEYNIDDIWQVVYGKGDYHSIHTHGNSDYSMVLYFDYDSGEHSGTHFVVEAVSSKTNSTLIKTPDAREGLIYVFPANILHFTSPNRSNKARRVISMDISLEGNVRADKI
jgi:hypothetical protein